MNGDVWTRCKQGHAHWGLYGAAGLFIIADSDDSVLLQRRALWSHHGGTWGIPGGARHSEESASIAAIREATEETGVDAAHLRITGEHTADHGGWSYVTVLARCLAPLPVRTCGESIAVKWVSLDALDSFDLHPGLRASLAALRAA
jgi:8-oxo-dGTP pyrophosphatase MutT (NUDIX family)